MRRALAESCDVFFYRVGPAPGGRPPGLVRQGLRAGGAHRGRAGPGGARADPVVDLEEKAVRRALAGRRNAFGFHRPGLRTWRPRCRWRCSAASVGNGGIRYRPAILNRVESMEGEVVFQAVPQELGRLPVSARNLKIVQQGHLGRGERRPGHGPPRAPERHRGRREDRHLAGRRAQGGRATTTLPPHLRPHAWFVCYAPAAAPRIAVAVVVENGEHGSSAAGPIAREMVKALPAPAARRPEGGRRRHPRRAGGNG
ncbi:MAG: penicillin-binding transpeptidase domain-containing protein [Desulfobacterales bacterium]|nr:penicillin-binding transpeptidase domain-containing protein [Desulfobacterales bacterium]